MSNQPTEITAQTPEGTNNESSQKRPEKLSLGKNMAWNSIGSLAYLGVMWLITVLVVRLSNDYATAGLLALAMSIANIFVPFAQYRMRIYQISDVEGEFNTGQYMGFRIVTIIIAFSGCMIYSFFTCAYDALFTIFLYLIFKSAESIVDVFHGLDQLNGRMDYIGISEIITAVALLVSFCAGMIFFDSLNVSIVLMTISIVIITALYDYGKSHQFDSLMPRFSLNLSLSLLKKCSLVTLANIACSATLTIPRQYLAASSGDAALGIYASVAIPIVLIQMGGSYVYGPLLSSFSEKYVAKDLSGFMKQFAMTLLGMFAIVAVLGALLYFFGPFLYPLLLGDQITEHLYLIPPLVICASFTAYLWFTNDLLLSIRSFSGSFVSNALTALLALAIFRYLVDTFGMNGVSFVGILAYGTAFALSTVIILVRVKKHCSAKQPSEG